MRNELLNENPDLKRLVTSDRFFDAEALLEGYRKSTGRNLSEAEFAFVSMVVLINTARDYAEQIQAPFPFEEIKEFLDLESLFEDISSNERKNLRLRASRIRAVIKGESQPSADLVNGMFKK